jgi:hypothetical protein
MDCPAYNKEDAADVENRTADLQLKPFFDKKDMLPMLPF